MTDAGPDPVFWDFGLALLELCKLILECPSATFFIEAPYLEDGITALLRPLLFNPTRTCRIDLWLNLVDPCDHDHTLRSTAENVGCSGKHITPGHREDLRRRYCLPPGRPFVGSHFAQFMADLEFVADLQTRTYAFASQLHTMDSLKALSAFIAPVFGVVETSVLFVGRDNEGREISRLLKTLCPGRTDCVVTSNADQVLAAYQHHMRTAEFSGRPFWDPVLRSGWKRVLQDELRRAAS
jgi:hypothetical protein